MFILFLMLFLFLHFILWFYFSGNLITEKQEEPDASTPQVITLRIDNIFMLY